MLSGKMLGEAGARVVLEECLEGEELSFLVMSDGERVAAAGRRAGPQARRRRRHRPEHRRHGRLLDADRLSTNRCATGWCSTSRKPVIAGMKAEGAEYKGILYCGLMMTARGPMVLEFNCRFGDPETQPIMMRLESDLLEAMEASIGGRVSDGDFRWSTRCRRCAW